MNTFKATASIYLSPYSSMDADDLQTADSLRSLTVWESAYDAPKDYTLVGSAEVTVTIASRDQIMNNKVDSLRAELERDRADSQQRQNALIRKISELEALTYEPAGEPA